MAHWCNVVLKKAAAAEVRSSRWAALDLALRLLGGPEDLAKWSAGWSREDGLLDNVSCEGVALVDFDDRRLLVHAGRSIQFVLPVRLAYLDRLRRAWPQWTVDWADAGVIDAARHLGWDSAPLDLTPLRAAGKAELGAPSPDGAFTWITLADGEAHDYPFAPEPGPLLLVGPELLDVCRGRATHPLPREDRLGGGLLLRPSARRLGWWSTGRLHPTDAQTEAAWREWTVERLPEGLRSQVAESGRDASLHMVTAAEVERCLEQELAFKPDSNSWRDRA
jgi:hypothetical protein